MPYKIKDALLTVVALLTAGSAFVKVINPEMGVVILSLAIGLSAAVDYLAEQNIIEKPKKR
jgi:hypothetical protein